MVLGVALYGYTDNEGKKANVVAYCNKENKLEKAKMIEKVGKLDIGDLLAIEKNGNGNYEATKINSLKEFYSNNQLINILMQLFNLMKKVNEELESDKEKENQKVRDLGLSENLDEKLARIIYESSNHSFEKKMAIIKMKWEFINTSGEIPFTLDNINNFTKIKCMEIILKRQSSNIMDFYWIKDAKLLLLLANDDNVDKDLLVNALEVLLKGNIDGNIENNDFVLYLKQQIQQKLEELKGKSRKLV